MNVNLEAAVKMIFVHGPSRVVINADGEAVPSRRAHEEHGINPDIILIRKDGWSLGAPQHLAAVAFGTWADCWIGFIQKPETKPRPMSEFPLG